MSEINVAVIGGRGYIGGELARLLLFHPEVNLTNITSETNKGKKLSRMHPNLRGLTDLKFSSVSDVKDADVVFLAVPHGKSFPIVKEFAEIGCKIINKSADFRLNDVNAYKEWYSVEHPYPELQKKFVYGLPELHREEIRKANLVSGPGCIATATILGLYPLMQEGLIDGRIIADAKIGSSAAGVNANPSTHHAERSRAIRSYKPVRHRHSAEILQEASAGKNLELHLTATSVETVRGILSTIHCFPNNERDEKEVKEIDLWKAYRKHYSERRFVRIVKEEGSIHKYPEPKILSGSNYCDIGFEMEEGRRIIALSALDNLMKGGAGQGIQCMNLMLGFNEETGLEFPGLHPV